MRDETDYWDMEPGTRLDIGTTAIEYIGEFNWEQMDTGGPDPLEDWTINLPSGVVLYMPEFERTNDRTVSAEWHGISFDTFNSGYLIRLTNDSEGAYVAHHYGK